MTSERAEARGAPPARRGTTEDRRADRRPRLPGDGLAARMSSRRARPARSSACLRRRSYLGWPAKRRWSNANFGHVLGLPPDDPRVRRLALRAYREYGRYLVELMRLPSLPPERGRPARREPRRTGCRDAPHLGGVAWRRAHPGRRPRRQQRGDRARASPSRGLPISVIADDTSFPELFELLRRQRAAWGVTLIPWRNLRAIFGVLRRREMLGLLVDWGYRSDGIPVRLFDAWTTLPAGPATLAAKTGSHILPVWIHRLPDGTFGVVLGRPDRRRLERPGRAPASEPGDRRRDGRRDPGRARPVVQLQADVARRRRRRRPTSSDAPGRCRPAGRIPGPAATCPATRPTRSGSPTPRP